MTQGSSSLSSALLAPDRAMREACERMRKLEVADPAAVAAAAGFDVESSMRAHHQDEETLLFPALVEAMAGSDAVCLRELAEALTKEHQELEASWRRARQAPGQPELLREFAEGYLRHVEREEAEFFPMLERLLSAEELAELEQKLRTDGSSLAGRMRRPD